jgi:hypothetical protein
MEKQARSISPKTRAERFRGKSALDETFARGYDVSEHGQGAWFIESQRSRGRRAFRNELDRASAFRSIIFFLFHSFVGGAR